MMRLRTSYLSRLFAGAFVMASLNACSNSDGGNNNVVLPGDPAHNGGSDPGNIQIPTPWNTLTWTYELVEGDDPAHAAGFQGKLVRGNDGTMYYGYLKYAYREATCDIAAFAGGPAPGVNYSLKVGVRAPGADTWAIETVPLENVGVAYVTSRFGLDAAIDNQGHPVFATAAGAEGLASCGSGDLVLATRNGSSSYSLTAPATASGNCCNICPVPAPANLTCCVDPACTSGTDVGAWAAIDRSATGTLGVAYMDYHNFWDEDGQNHAGIELWESSGGFSGIRPWSGQGIYSAFRYTGNSAIVAFSGQKSGGLQVLRKDNNDWVATPISNLFNAWDIGERIQLAVAPDGTVGLLFHAAKNSSGVRVNELYYCSTADGGATWSQCQLVDTGVGGNPALAFDSANHPVASYYYCGPNSTCPQSSDRPRLAFRDSLLAWWQFDLYNEADKSAGLYTTLVLDPTTGEPTLAFQDLTRGAAMVAQGHFQN